MNATVHARTALERRVERIAQICTTLCESLTGNVKRLIDSPNASAMEQPQ